MSIDYYLSDGVYWNYEKCNRDYNDERAHRQELARYARKLKLISNRTKSPRALRRKIFLIFLSDGLKRMALRYCKLENLPSDYAIVAMQDESLKDIIINHLLVLNLDFKDIEICELVNSIYLNKDRTNVYARVGKIQNFVHNIASTKFGINGKNRLDKEAMRRLLSISRLHIHVTELKKADFRVIKEEMILNRSMSLSCNKNYPAYLHNSDKKYIKNWSKRHLHSLLFYATQEEREFLRKLLNESEDLSISKLIKEMTHEWPKFEPILKS